MNDADGEDIFDCPQCQIMYRGLIKFSLRSNRASLIARSVTPKSTPGTVCETFSAGNGFVRLTQAFLSMP